MTASALFDTTDAVGLAEHVARGDVTPVELVEEAIERIETIDGPINSVCHRTYEYARAAAARADGSGPLAGVPLLLKDILLEWEGLPLTNASRYFASYRSTSDWTIAKRLKAGGLIPVGRSNSPECGLQTTTEPVLHGPTRNPWDLTRVAGGSSGGSAAAVAARLVPIADATDGGGSIRIPASINGVVGLKVSRGRTTVGPPVTDVWYGAGVSHCVSNTVRDTAAYLDVVGGAVAGDPYPLPMPHEPYLELIRRPPGSLRIGVVRDAADGDKLHPDVLAVVDATAAVCEHLGHEVVETDLHYDVAEFLHHFGRMGAAWLAASFSPEVTATIGREVTPDDLEPLTWAHLERGRRLTAADHIVDVEWVRSFGRSLVQRLDVFDIVVAPTLDRPPREIGEVDGSDARQHAARRTQDIALTAPFNASGQPALSLPVGVSTDGLPIGVQLIGRIGDEAGLLALGKVLEEAMPWGARRPDAGRGGQRRESGRV